MFNSMVEDYFTGFILHCKGWKSILCNPSRPAFLGSATTNLNDALVQGTRWNCGLLEVTFSKFCPPFCGLSRMSLLQTMCYGYFSFQPLHSLPLWCLATVPQLSFEWSFSLPTGNYVVTITMLLAPLATLVILNMIAFAGGIARMVISGTWNEMLGQIILSFYIILVNYPITEGMTLRIKGKFHLPSTWYLWFSPSFSCAWVPCFFGLIVTKFICERYRLRAKVKVQISVIMICSKVSDLLLLHKHSNSNTLKACQISNSLL